ncbi:hypothetical protein [Streptosporangium sp. NPDC050280]|uniref:hypothetical protein n=1 Tax=unclassified Streptosporangium TaxID=2632669 RepID=UPI003431FAF7
MSRPPSAAQVTPPPRTRTPVHRVLRRVIAVAVGVCARLGAVRLVVPATAGTADEPPGVGGS